MKKIIVLVILLLNSLMSCSIDTTIVFDSSVLKVADGTLIDADQIEFIIGFRRMLLAFIFGDLLPNNQRKGKYNFCGKFYSVESLARIEAELDNAENVENLESKRGALQELLTHVKAEFIVRSSVFIENGRGAKNIMTVLIQEDCQKRNRPDSLLLEWSRTKEGQESTMFERQVTSFGSYYHFLTDLVNFLLDLIHNCPKAEAQFKDRVVKWSAVKEMLSTVLKKAHVKSENINETEFLKYIKERYLDQIALNEITPQTIVPLLVEYMKHT